MAPKPEKKVKKRRGQESSLAKQLRVHRVTSEKPKDKIVSYCFSAKHLKTLDRHTLLGIGLKGLSSLVEIDSRFNDFVDTIFRDKVVEYDRLTTQVEEVKLYDEAISDLLMLLSPHFLREGASYVIEFLIQFYESHIYNVDSIIRCILPYHGHGQFLKLLTLCQLDFSKLFGFLQPNITQSRPLDRATLLKQCRRDTNLLKQIIRWTEQSVNRDLARSANINLCTSLVMDGLADQDPDNKHMHFQILKAIAPCMFRSYKHPNREWRTAGLMMTVAVCHTEQLASEMLQGLVAELLSALFAVVDQGESGFMDLLKCVVYVFQSQLTLEDAERQQVPTELWSVDWAPYMEDAVEVFQKYDATSFLRYAFASMAKQRLYTEPTNPKSDKDNSDQASPDLLQMLLLSVESSVAHVQYLVTFCWQCLDGRCNPEQETAATNLLAMVETKFPIEFDAAVTYNMSRVRDKDRVLNIIEHAVGCKRHVGMLAVLNTVSAVRQNAVKKLDSVMPAVGARPHDILYVQETVAHILQTDDSEDVIKAAFLLKCLPRLQIDALKMLPRILVKFQSHSSTIALILKRLPEMFNGAAIENKEHAQKDFVALILPWLMVSDKDHVPISKAAAEALAEIDPTHFQGLTDHVLFEQTDLQKVNANMVAMIAVNLMMKDESNAAQWTLGMVEYLVQLGIQPDSAAITHNGLTMMVSVLSEVIAASFSTAKASPEFGHQLLRATSIPILRFAQFVTKATKSPGPIPSSSTLLGKPAEAQSVALVLSVCSDLMGALLKAIPKSMLNYAKMELSTGPWHTLQQIYLSLCHLRASGCDVSPSMLLLFNSLGESLLPFLSTFWMYPLHATSLLNSSSLSIPGQALSDATLVLASHPGATGYGHMILPSVLVPLASESKSIRALALSLISALENAKIKPVPETMATQTLLYKSALPFVVAPKGNQDVYSTFFKLIADEQLILKQKGNVDRIPVVLSQTTDPATLQWLLTHAVAWFEHYPLALKVLLKHLQPCIKSPIVLHALRPLLEYFHQEVNKEDRRMWICVEGEIANLLFSHLAAIGVEGKCSDIEFQLLIATIHCSKPLAWDARVLPAQGIIHAEMSQKDPGQATLYSHGLALLNERPSTVGMWNKRQKEEMVVAMGSLLNAVAESGPPETLSRCPELHKIAHEHFLLCVKNTETRSEDEEAPAKKTKVSRANVDQFLSTPTNLLEVLSVFHSENATPAPEVIGCGKDLMIGLHNLLTQMFRSSLKVKLSMKDARDYLVVLALNLYSRLVITVGPTVQMEYAPDDLIAILRKSDSYEARKATLKLLINIGHQAPKQAASACIRMVHQLARNSEDVALVKDALTQLLPIVMRNKKDMATAMDPSTTSTAQLFVAILLLLQHEWKLHGSATGENGVASKSKPVDMTTFCHNLLLEFSVGEQLNTLSHLVLALYPSSKANPSAKALRDLAGFEKVSHGLRGKALAFIAEHLQLPALVKALEEQQEQDIEAMEEDANRALSPISTRLAEMFITIMMSFDLLDQLSGGVEETQEIIEATRWVLNALNGIATIPVFITSITVLLEKGKPVVKQIAMQLLADKIEASIPVTPAHAELFLSLLPTHQTLLQDTVTMEWGERAYADQLATLGSAEVMARCFAETYPNSFEPLLQVVTTILNSHSKRLLESESAGYKVKSQEQNIVSKCAGVLAHVCTHVSGSSIKYLPKYYPVLLKLLGATLQYQYMHKKDMATNLLMAYQAHTLQSLSTLTQALIKSGPGFVQPYIAIILSICAHRNVMASPDETVIEEARKLLVALGPLDFRLMDTPLRETLMGCNINAVDHCLLWKLYEKALTNNDQPPSIYKEHVMVTMQPFYIKYLAGLCSMDVVPVEVALAVGQAINATILRVTEREFRSLFEGLKEWCWGGKKQLASTLQVFYSIATTLASNLQEVFGRYFLSILDHTVAVLEGPNKQSVAVVLDFLGAVFQDLSTMKMKQDQWNMLLTRIIDQIKDRTFIETWEHAASLPTMIIQGCKLGGAMVWKDVQKHIIPFMTMEDTDIVADALRLIEALYGGLGFDFAHLCIAEFLPRLFEMLEHHDEQLQELATSARATIERALGEDLEKYLK